MLILYGFLFWPHRAGLTLCLGISLTFQVVLKISFHSLLFLIVFVVRYIIAEDYASVYNEENLDMGEKVERRESFRLPISTEAICRVNENTFHGTICDVSVTGLFMETAEGPPTASKCDIDIVFPGNHSCLRVEKIKGVVTRLTERGVGIKFDDRLEWIALVPIYFHKMQKEVT